MGSFCGTYGYGLIHPNVINASVLQVSYASTHSHTAPQWKFHKGPNCPGANFDAMSIAPTFDLQLEACTAEDIASIIVFKDTAMKVTADRSPVRTPGSTSDKKGSLEDIQKEIDVMTSVHRFGNWMGGPSPTEPLNPDRRCRTRLDLACYARPDEDELAKPMSKLIPHMGAHIRAYHFLCFQTQLGYRDNVQITLDEVAKVIPMIIEQRRLKPRPRSDYDKYLTGGNLNQIA